VLLHLFRGLPVLLVLSGDLSRAISLFSSHPFYLCAYPIHTFCSKPDCCDRMSGRVSAVQVIMGLMTVLYILDFFPYSIIQTSSHS